MFYTLIKHGGFLTNNQNARQVLSILRGLSFAIFAIFLKKGYRENKTHEIYYSAI